MSRRSRNYRFEDLAQPNHFYCLRDTFHRVRILKLAPFESARHPDTFHHVRNLHRKAWVALYHLLDMYRRVRMTK